MKVLAINGSPRGKDGNTDIILQGLLLGMQQAGAEVETGYLNKLNIKPCIGCLTCWFKTPGKCVHHDDMQKILPKLFDFDLIIYATPLYVYSMTGIMKDFLDRTIQIDSPLLTENKKITEINKQYKRYGNRKIQRMFLVSSAGFPELKHFDSLVHTFKSIAEAMGLKYSGEIMRPAAWLLKTPEMQDKVAVYKEDLRVAGKCLVEQARVDESLSTKLHELWITKEEYYDSCKKLCDTMEK
jgi:multimeric flavodoxin WrbA